MVKSSDKLFEELFPRSAVHFHPEVATILRRGGSDTEQGRFPSWFCVWTSDSLLRRTASWREDYDLFSTYAFWRQLSVFCDERAICTMVKRKEVIRDDQKAEWKGFLDRRLTDDELSGLDEWRPKPSELWSEVDSMLQGGLRITLSYNKKTKLASATIIDDDPSRATGGYALSNADSDGALSLKMAVYKHAILLERDWSALLTAPPKVRRG